MRKFAISTTSESGDRYIYFIEHPKKPSMKDAEKWLSANANDIQDGVCYEYIESITEITSFKRM